MVVLDLPAKMKCDADTCDAKLGVELVLQGGGGFGILPPHGHGWEVKLLANGVYSSMCPNHRTSLIAPSRKLERIQ